MSKNSWTKREKGETIAKHNRNGSNHKKMQGTTNQNLQIKKQKLEQSMLRYHTIAITDTLFK